MVIWYVLYSLKCDLKVSIDSQRRNYDIQGIPIPERKKVKI